jgi:hypothetical protein
LHVHVQAMSGWCRGGMVWCGVVGCSVQVVIQRIVTGTAKQLGCSLPARFASHELHVWRMLGARYCSCTCTSLCVQGAGGCSGTVSGSSSRYGRVAELPVLLERLAAESCYRNQYSRDSGAAAEARVGAQCKGQQQGVWLLGSFMPPSSATQPAFHQHYRSSSSDSTQVRAERTKRFAHVHTEVDTATQAARCCALCLIQSSAQQ